VDAVRMIQKHCKDHIAESTAKRVTNRYHPYANTTTDISQHLSDTDDVTMVDTMDNTMDLDGMFSHVHSLKHINSSGKIHRHR